MTAQSLRAPRAGERAPDFDLEAVDGTRVALATTPLPVVLCFLRHLA